MPHDPHKSAIQYIMPTRILTYCPGSVSLEMTQTSHFMSCECLSRELRSPNPQVLVLDCRNALDYVRSHIRCAINVTIPSLLLRRLANGKISVPSIIKCKTSRERLIYACSSQTIVLCGDGTNEDPTVSSTMNILYKRLLLEETRVFCLEGGFAEFSAGFPEWCESEGKEPSIVGLRSLRINCESDPRFPDSKLKRIYNEFAEASDEDRCDSSFGESPEDDTFPVEILPYLFLGNAQNSEDEDALRRHHIQYILNVTHDLPNAFENKGSMKYMQIPISDHWSENLGNFFPAAIAFIEEAKERDVGVLVHCLAGISRSVTITVAYLMFKMNLSLNDAFDFVKKRKANISPNFNFMGQLRDFERERNSPVECICNRKSVTEKKDSETDEESEQLVCRYHSLHFSTPAKPSPDSGIDFDRWA